MAGRGMHTSGPSSGSQEALHSMISQFQTKIKSNESVISSNKKRISSLEDQNVSLKRENSLLKERISSLERENEHMKKTHGKQKSDRGDLVLSPKAMPRNREDTPFCAEIFEGKLSHDPEVKLRFVHLASRLGEKLSQLGDAQAQESNRKFQIENWQATGRHLLQFFVLLHGIVINSGISFSASIPSWLDMVLENQSNQSIRQDMCKMWRLLHWHIHHSINKSKKGSPKSQMKIDGWFTQQMEKQEIPDDVELAVANLLKFMSRDFGVVKEEAEGLSMSISMEPEEESSGVSSSDSSLSSTIPAQDLWTFKSILQDLVERIDEFYQKYALLMKSTDLDGLDEMERDMYLPQREALENYDLGKLLRLMSSVIQRLSQEVISVNAERGLCQRCQQDISMEAKGVRSNDPAFHNQGTKVQPMGFISAGSSSGLKSRESTGQIPGVKLPRIPNLMMTGGAVPMAPTAMRPVQGTFQGIHGPMPSRQLTILQNTTAHARSKSDTSVSPQQRKVVDQSLVSKPSSLDSVFRQKSSPLDISTSPPSVTFSHQSGENLSDSDDDFQVRGPPDTPPEVRSIERMQLGADSLERPSESSGRLGAFSKYAMQSASQPRYNGALLDRRFPSSHVHQCTGDSSGTTHDMVLPSSVHWSTVQLKDGGMASPTLEDMSPRNTAQHRSQHMNYFSTIPQDTLHTYAGDVERDGFDTLTNVPSASADAGGRDPCPVCKMTFPDYVPMQAVQSHINLHFDENPGSFEVINENYNSLNK